MVKSKENWYVDRSQIGLIDGYRNSEQRNNNVGLTQYHNSILGYMNSPVTGITSRDQIINPYELINYDFYGRNARGKALAEQHLNALLDVQAKQEASYQEWYNSEEQQANRLRDAGLNPNLNELESSQSSQATVGQGSPLEGIPTSNEVALQGVSTAASLGSMLVSGVSAFSQLAALPASIASAYASAGASAAAAGLSTAQANLANANAESINLESVSKFESLASADVAARLADATAGFVGNAANAGKEFDFAGWFSDPKNSEGILEAYAPTDHPRYKAALSRVMSNHQKSIGSMYDVYGNRLKHQSTVAEMLASPYYDENLLLQISLFEPLMNARKEIVDLQNDYEIAYHKLELSKLNEIDQELYLNNLSEELRARIAENAYKTDYFNNFDGSDSALYDMYIKKAESLQQLCRASMENNLLQVYNNAPRSYIGQRAATLLLGGAHMNWEDYIAWQLNANVLNANYNEQVDTSGSINNPFHPRAHIKFGSSDNQNYMVNGMPLFPDGVHF